MPTDPSVLTGLATSEPPPLTLIPAWRRPAFWFFFALGAWWGAVLGSAAAVSPFVWRMITPSIGPEATQRIVDNVASAVHGEVSSTPLGATLIVWTFTLGGGLLIGAWGLRWRDRRQPGGTWLRGEL